MTESNLNREKLRAVLGEMSNTDLAWIAHEISFIGWCRELEDFAVGTFSPDKVHVCEPSSSTDPTGS